MHILSHRRDAVLVFLTVIDVALFFWMIAQFDNLSWPVIIAAGTFKVFMSGLSSQSMGHYFIHNPFFQSFWLNSAYSFVTTFSLLVPLAYFTEHHLNHHAHSNRLSNRDGTGHGDLTSVYRHADKVGQQQNIWLYCLTRQFRYDVTAYTASAMRRGRGRQAIVEGVAFLVFHIFVLLWNWQAWLFFVAPVTHLGLSFCQFWNYQQHNDIDPHDRNRDSVSCYGAVFNALFFNSGYHQEHHLYPNAHWSTLPDCSKRLPPEDDRHVVSVSPWLRRARPAGSEAR